MFLAKLESLIFLCLLIVFIPGMIVSKIIQLHKAGCDPIRYSFCTIFCKKIMSGIFFFIFLAVSHSIYACLKMAGICIGIVRCLPVCCAEKSQLADLDPVKVIDHMLLQIRQCIGSLSVVGIDRIKFVGIKEIIVTAAANGTDPFQLIVIFENAHKTGNITFHRRFVDNTGMSDTTFAPINNVTREQMATILFRYTKTAAPDKAKASADLSGFADAGNVNDWAVDAMRWAVGQKLIAGITLEQSVYLQPRGNATRAQAATVLTRYYAQ